MEGRNADKAYTLDLRGYPDGSYISRDPFNNCKFEPCLEICDNDDDHCSCWDDLGHFIIKNLWVMS